MSTKPGQLQPCERLGVECSLSPGSILGAIGSFVSDNWTYIAAAGVCFTPGVGWVGCGAANAFGWGIRTESRESSGDPLDWSAETWVDGGLTGTFWAFGGIGNVLRNPASANAAFKPAGAAAPSGAIWAGSASKVSTNAYAATIQRAISAPLSTTPAQTAAGTIYNGFATTAAGVVNVACAATGRESTAC